MLNVVSAQKALEIIKDSFSEFNIGCEAVALSESTGRVICENVVAAENIPAFDRSTVDGFAVKASDTFGSSESVPSQLNVIGEVLMGQKAEAEISSGQCVKISTGGMLPKGADSVVMVEHTDCTFDDFCLILKAVSPFENVTKTGDDTKTEDVVFEKGKLISSREIGVLASLGIKEIKVTKKPRVGIISTGDEIVPVDTQVPFGKIRDINSHILSALMTELGCISTQYGIVKDDYQKIKNILQLACKENDIVLISGGSSAGARDMTGEIISSLGELYFHGIAIKPGKPTIFGKINDKAVFGLPGHPAASYFVALLFIKPLIEMMRGCSISQAKEKGNLVCNISSNHGREELVCVKIENGNVKPIYGKSGIISLLSRSDGYIIIDRNCEGLKQGDEVEINLF